MRYDELSRSLESISPTLHRLARVPWRIVRDHLPVTSSYWAHREHMAYYIEVVALARRWEPGGGRMIDVGSASTRVLSKFDWFAERVALDLNWIPRQRGVTRVRSDFLRYHPARPFDLVTCLQVLEHQEDPQPFARKLLTIGRTVLVSVPYRWPAGASPDHVQDPIDEAKLARWMGCEPRETRVVANGKKRLIAVYRSGPA